MKQIERIQAMEQLLNEAEQALLQVHEHPEEYFAAQEKIAKLEAYYTSPLWMKDFEDDCKGKLPPSLKRGVLSEDAIDTLLHHNKELMIEYKSKKREIDE